MSTELFKTCLQYKVSELMDQKAPYGKFDVIDSFAILRRNEFYLIGHLTEGVMQEGWFAYITLNKSLSLTLRISRIEYVLMKAGEEYPTLVISSTDEEIDLLLSLSVGLEPVFISPEGVE